MIRVFLSWSGETSREVAEILNKWLPRVLQNVEPFMSAGAIAKGAKWLEVLTERLEGSTFGIICVTAENVRAPWLNFEVGALAHSVNKARVAPFLIGIEPRDLAGLVPVDMFQATSFDKTQIFQLIQSINEHSSDRRLDSEVLKETFERFWPDLEEKLTAMQAKALAESPPHGQQDSLDEMLELLRAQRGLIGDPGALLPAAYLRKVMDQVLSRRSGADAEFPEVTPLNAVAAARYSISGILNCEIDGSYDADQQDAFLQHRRDEMVRVRRLVAKAGQENEKLIKELAGQARRQYNYEVRVSPDDRIRALGSWAFSVMDRDLIVVRMPHQQAFAARHERAAYLLGEYFESLWASADVPAALGGARRTTAADS